MLQWNLYSERTGWLRRVAERATAWTAGTMNIVDPDGLELGRPRDVDREQLAGLQAVILRGKPSELVFSAPQEPSTSDYFWLPWLQKQLAIRGAQAHTPEVPNAYLAHYPTWQQEFERYAVDENTVLIGHSCGAGFLLRWLSEHPQVRARTVVLVAPWTDPGRAFTTDFFDFTLDRQLAARAGGVTLLYSTDDEDSVLATVRVAATRPGRGGQRRAVRTWPLLRRTAHDAA